MSTRMLSVLICASLLAAVPVDGSDDEAPPPWLGGLVEYDDVTLTIPEEWAAVDLDVDLERQAVSMAEHVRRETGGCPARSCAPGLRDWLDGEDPTVRLLATGLIGDDAVPGTCRVHRTADLEGHPLSDIAGLLHDVFARSPGVEMEGPPVALPREAGDAYAFDFSSPANDVSGTVYVTGNGDRFVWMRCEGASPPPDRWGSVWSTLELIDGDGDALMADANGDGASELQAMLPLWVAGRPLASYSASGLDYFRRFGRASEEQLQAVEEDPNAWNDLLPPGVSLDDFEFANAGRATPEHPPFFVTAFRIVGLQAGDMPLSMVVDHDDPEGWTTAEFGGRQVLVGTEAMLKRGRPGRPFVYDAGDVRFVITTTDESWAREAAARIRPDPVQENAALLVVLPDDWRSGWPQDVGIYDESGDDREPLAIAHGTRQGRSQIPSLTIYDTGTRLDGDASAVLDGWADHHRTEPWPDWTVHSVERLSLASGEAIRFEMTVADAPVPEDVVVLYRIAAPGGVFDLDFTVAPEDLPELTDRFADMADSFMARDRDPDGALARLARGELSRGDYELLAAGLTVVPEAQVSSDP